MAGPEHNPADDVQPTKEEYESWERNGEFSKLYDYVQAMIRDNVAHKTKGFRLGEMTIMDQIGHLGDEAFEVQTATSKLDRQMEIADCFGVVLHMAIAEGMTAEQLVGAVLGKLQIRFEAPRQ